MVRRLGEALNNTLVVNKPEVSCGAFLHLDFVCWLECVLELLEL